MNRLLDTPVADGTSLTLKHETGITSGPYFMEYTYTKCDLSIRLGRESLLDKVYDMFK